MPLPNAEPGASSARRGWRHVAPRTFQARLTLAIVAIVAVVLTLVSALVLNRLDDVLRQQQTDELRARAELVARYAKRVAESEVGFGPIVGLNRLVDLRVVSELSTNDSRGFLANRLGQADVAVRFGNWAPGRDFLPGINGTITATFNEPLAPNQEREELEVSSTLVVTDEIPYAIDVSLSNPVTVRASTIARAAGVLAVISLAALAVAAVVAMLLAQRFTAPLRQLSEASRALAEGDLSRRVSIREVRRAPTELVDLARQFNTMAARLEESVAIVRRDRDRGREFLADVSHELRTPIAAMRTFNELLVEGAAADPEARAEFLEASRIQLERLDWLAQNLLELSKLDSGLVLLELRPDDIRGTVEQAVDTAMPAARRRGVELRYEYPDGPLRVHHDAQRVGQVVANLISNGLKFTPPGGHVLVRVGPEGDGARIEVADTGVGIGASEMPHIFERFYRGSQANEARGSGSGLGLAIVKSIVDMHGGTIQVESRVGAGTRFTVTLPRDPRLVEAPGAPAPSREAADGDAAVPGTPAADLAPARSAEMVDPSSTGGSRVNPDPAR
jgi:signal transduction histidine kinase